MLFYFVLSKTWTIFAKKKKMSQPLAERMRPKTLDEYIGQQHLVGKGAVLRKMIDAKNAAIQSALRAENEVKEAEANAKIAIAKAEGEARALKIKADGEAYYNRTVAASLNELLVKQDAIEKWDGKLPTYNGGGAVPFLNIK